MFVTGGTRRMWPLRNVGAQTDEYSLTADWDNQWLTGGLEPDVIAEAHLDTESIFAGVQRFAKERSKRLDAQRSALAALSSSTVFGSRSHEESRRIFLNTEMTS